MLMSQGGSKIVMKTKVKHLFIFLQSVFQKKKINVTVKRVYLCLEMAEPERESTCTSHNALLSRELIRQSEAS